MKKEYQNLSLLASLLIGLGLLAIGVALLSMKEEAGITGIAFIVMGAVNIMIAALGKTITWVNKQKEEREESNC